ncbi:hypothetical protein [Spiroplasma endosymbiont of Labia minor]|uniref:hypothetical protein n=1 Tax=Spiroplasma endosymbiont of Labia minor TaxID=3066305 RepID=UPI0030CC89E6
MSVGFSINTLVTDVLSIFGLFLLWFAPAIFSVIHKKVLRQRLFTKVDGKKLFEKLKFDIRINGKLEGINRKRLFRDPNYALTIFNKAMDYNKRDLIWYFNENTAKYQIARSISNKSGLNFLVWFIFISVSIISSLLDVPRFFFHGKMESDNGLGAIILLLIVVIFFTVLLKYFQWFSVKKTLNDDVRQINLAKKQLVWNDFRLIYWSEISILGFGFFLIILNQFF